jgi:hypothetical protein
MKTWRQSKEYSRWKKKVLDRDGKCFLCKTAKNLHAHHVNNARYFPDERFLITNGVALCEACHTQYHCNYHASFREQCTKKDFGNFIELFVYFDLLFSKT